MRRTTQRPKRIRSSSRALNLFAASAFACLVPFIGFAARPPAAAPRTSEPPLRIVNDDDIVLVQTPSRPIARGERIGGVPTTLLKWPKSRLSSEYILDMAQYGNAVALTPLPELLPIPISAVTEGRLDNNQVALAIPDGMRAITVRVDAESAVEGWAQSGNYVDVILVRPVKDGQSGLETFVIAENIKIVSAGRSAEPLAAEQIAPKTPTTVTLLTNQSDTLKIKTAANLGKLTFALRGSQDRAPTVVTETTERKVFEEGRPSKPLKHSYRGHARGPDGSSWIYSDEQGWLQTDTPAQLATSPAKLTPNATTPPASPVQ
ncbi:MAG: Flp pilus assembly protein CpaB [Bdellovibrionota bacterium]